VATLPHRSLQKALCYLRGIKFSNPSILPGRVPIAWLPLRASKAIAEVLLQLSQEPTNLQRCFCSDKRRDRSSTTASASAIGYTTASTLSRSSCCSAVMRL
jgi:hypothetical protein